MSKDMSIEERIGYWSKTIAELKNSHSNQPGDVFGKGDMVANMEKNLERIKTYNQDLKGKSGAEAIKLLNHMEAYFISLDLANVKLGQNVLQHD